jgi:uncharacterized repeat protein (TIGR01451 family)
MKVKLLGFGVALLATATIGFTQLNAEAAVDTTRDCDQFAVIRCGTMSVEEARDKYDQGSKIFQTMGVSKQSISGDMKNGVVYRDGRVVVNGKTVATGAKTAIRNMSGGSKIAGTNAAIYPASAMGSAQTALVKFDKDGRFLFAIMKPCGNPVTATPTKEEPKPPVVTCDGLNRKKLSRDTAQFTAKATAKNGAKINGYLFTVKKGSKVVQTKKNNKGVFTYKMKEAGDYSVRVTVLSSKGKITGPKCVKPLSLKPLDTPTPGVKIEKLVEGADYFAAETDVEYDYQIKVTNTGETTLKNVVVTDTPEKGVTLLSADQGDISDNTWTYTIPKLTAGQDMSFTLSAKVPEYLAGRINNTACVNAPEVPGNPDDCDDAEVEVEEPGKTIVCDPETGDTISVDEEDASNYPPVGSEECEEKTPEEPSNPKASTPEELPTTGPAETILQLIGATSLTGAGSYYLASRRNG